jgi:hypothetical protein
VSFAGYDAPKERQGRSMNARSSLGRAMLVSTVLAVGWAIGACSGAPEQPKTNNEVLVEKAAGPTQPDAPTTLDEALVGLNTAVLIRFEGGGWSEFSGLSNVLEQVNRQAPVSVLAKHLTESGVAKALDAPGIDMPPHLQRLLADATDDGAGYLRIDALVTPTDRELFSRGLFVVPPPRAVSAAYTLTFLVPVDEPDATRSEVAALAAGEPVIIEQLGEYVVLRQTASGSAEPPPLAKHDLPDTPGLKKLSSSDAPLTAWIRPEQAFWADIVHDYRGWIERSVGSSRDSFATDHLSVSMKAGVLGFTMPPRANEVAEWVVSLSGKGDGAELELTSSYTAAGRQAYAAARTPQTAVMPIFEVPEDARERVFFASQGAASPKALAAWVESLDVPETDFNTPYFIESELDSVTNHPHFWAAPLQLAIRGFSKMKLYELADALSWSFAMWTDETGRLGIAAALWFPKTPEEIKREAPWLAQTDLRVAKDGTVVSFTMGDGSMTMSPAEQWRTVPTDRFWIEFTHPPSSRPEPVLRELPVRADVRLAETGVLARAVVRPSQDDSWEPQPMESLDALPTASLPACLIDARQLYRQLTLQSLLAFDSGRDVAIDPFKQLDKIDEALKGCESPVTQVFSGRIAWLRGLFVLRRNGTDGTAEEAFRRACDLGVEQACGDAVTYYRARDCPEPHFRRVMVATGPLGNGARVSSDTFQPGCLPRGMARPTHVRPEDFDEHVGREIRVYFDKDSPLDTNHLKPHEQP